MSAASPSRIYLDNAATSWPKPEGVYQAVDAYQRHNGAAAGRGLYDEATAASAQVQQTRQLLADLLGVQEARRIAFTYSGTDALNTALHGVLTRPGSHVITTALEHNSVLRPLTALADAGHIRLTILQAHTQGQVQPSDVAAALTPDTRLVAVTQASNVTGIIQPIAEIGQLTAPRPECLLLVDACQSLGHIPVDVGELSVDLLAASGHKGLLGPLGTGLLYTGPKAEPLVQPLRHGGTGTASDELRQPWELPERFEAGNLNLPGLVGLAAGIRYLREHGSSSGPHERALTGELLASLEEIPGVTLHPGMVNSPRVGLVSLTIAGYEPQEVAAILASSYQIQVRAGLHCAPLAHRQLGTFASGGTVRLSLGPFTTSEQIQQTVAAIAEIAATGLTA